MRASARGRTKLSSDASDERADASIATTDASGDDGGPEVCSLLRLTSSPHPTTNDAKKTNPRKRRSRFISIDLHREPNAGQNDDDGLVQQRRAVERESLKSKQRRRVDQQTHADSGSGHEVDDRAGVERRVDEEAVKRGAGRERLAVEPRQKDRGAALELE